MTGEESESREASEGGYVAIRKNDQTPVTKLRLHKGDGLPATQFKLLWSSSKIRIWKDEQRTRAVTSNQTTFAANVDTDVFLEGVTKSDAASDAEVGLKVVLGTTESTPVPVKLTVVQSEFPVTNQAFIPYRWVDIPLAWLANFFAPGVPFIEVAEGDNRGYDPTLARSFRGRQSFIVTPFEDLSPDKIKAGSIVSIGGESVHYESATSVLPAEQNQIHGSTLVIILKT